MSPGKEERPVLVVAPHAKDAQALVALLADARIAFDEAKAEELPAALDERCPHAVILTEDALGVDTVSGLIEWARRQPDWSALPVLLLAREPDNNRTGFGGILDPTGSNRLHVTLLPRPAHPDVVLNAIAAALGSRQRQYRLRDQIAALETERKRTEMLAREVQHRAKNNLSVLLGILNQLRRRTDDPDELVRAFSQRTTAFARGLDLLNEHQWTGGSLREVIEREVQAVAPQVDETFVWTGPTFVLSSDATLNLHLVFHELATNAAKYGALSLPGGRIEVAAALEGDVIALEWRESGGPPVSPPSSEGLGSQLIRLVSMQLGGTVAYAFDRDGLRCRVELAASSLTRDAGDP